MSSELTNGTPDDSGIILYKKPDGKGEIRLLTRDGSVWLSQAQMAELFGTSTPNISMHVANILKEKELEESSVIKYYLTTAADGKKYNTIFYSLDMILAVGYRVRGVRGVLFRQWATAHLKEYIVKGFVIDDERLKNPDGRPDYFDELLARIRDIRASEKRFYQKVRDLLALSSDYDPSDKATQMFFAEVQNKLLYAVTRQTAAEIVVSRASSDKPNMGLTSWRGNIVRKGDVIIAKNYLSAEEIDQLNRLTVIFLETAELRVQSRRDLTLDYWRNNVDRLLEFNDKPVLQGKGSISSQQAEKIVNERYDLFNERRKKEDARLADETDLKELKAIEDQLKKRKSKE
ncbi:MAG: virulence RhuM family protein [Thermoguttaceae bacterium]|nr:virulence RhuM family protein [Thermoguttaceae bacterium]